MFLLQVWESRLHYFPARLKIRVEKVTSENGRGPRQDERLVGVITIGLA